MLGLRLLQAISWCVGKLGYRAMGVLGAALGWFVGSVLRIRRRHAEAAMVRAGVPEPRKCVRKVYENLATNVFELLWLAARPGEPQQQRVRIDGWSRVQRAVDEGRGVIVATAHTGNWDLAACFVAQRMDLTVVTKHLSNKSIDAFWQRLRGARGVRLVDPKGAIESCKNALKQGHSVCFLTDQAPHRASGVETIGFLGAPAEHDAAFAIMAARYRVPIVVALMRRQPDFTHLIEVVDVIEPPQRESQTPMNEWVRCTVVKVSQHVEHFILQYPDQWLWLHRRWRTDKSPSRFNVVSGMLDGTVDIDN